VVRRELARLDSAIAAQRAQAEAQERSFQEDIAKARDRDLQIELDRSIEKANAAFMAEVNPFKGFSALLGTSCLLDLFTRVVTQPAAATEAGRRFHLATVALIDPIREGLVGITHGSLAGPIFVHRMLALNREAAAALSERLDALPLAQLEAGRQRACAILSVSFASVPSFDTFEKPDELEGVRSRLFELLAIVERHTSELRSEINDEPTELRETIDHAEADIKSSVGEAGDRAKQSKEVLARAADLWSLIQRGSVSGNLPVFARKLCRALAQDFARRANTSVEAVLREATISEFGLKDIEALIESHVMKGYVGDRKRLRTRLTESEKRLDEVHTAIQRIDERYEEVARAYRTRLVLAAVLSSIPAVGVVGSLWASSLVRRLEPLVTSDKAPYISLGHFAFAALAWAVAGATIFSMLATIVTFTLYRDEVLDGEALLTATCYLALVIAIRNLSTINSHLHQCRQLASTEGGDTPGSRRE
jgi:hypothetical protein